MPCNASSMARNKVSMQAEFPYHVTARCINQDWFSVPLDQVWIFMSEQLYFVQRAFEVKVIAFVLMNNHFHLLIQTPSSNLDQAMRWFMRETSRSLTAAGNRDNQTYGGRYFRSILSTDLYLLHAYKYVYLNPIRAGLVDHILDYPFSSLPCVLGLRPLPFAIHDDLLISSTAETLSWLEHIPSRENSESVRKALRRRIFQLGKIRTKLHPLEVEMF
jgi:putative transposase